MKDQPNYKVKILVLEDEVIIADHLVETLVELGYEVPEACLSYSEAVSEIKKGVPDLAIIDINLSGRKTGIDLAHFINEDYHFPFIFLTSNTDKATLEAAKKVAPAAFLVKPYQKEDLYTSIEVALFNFAEQRRRSLNKENLFIKDALFVKKKQTFHRVELKDILYIESSHIYLDLVLQDGERFTIRSSFAQLADKLDGRFERVHRGYFINMDHLQGISGAHLIVGGMEVPVSKAHRERILKGIQVS